MKIHIEGSGEVDGDEAVKYVFVAETETHKTTLEFYSSVDTFVEFAQGLAEFPFKNKKDVVYEEGNWENSGHLLTMTATLASPVGFIDFLVETKVPEDNAEAKFLDAVDAESLARFSRKLLATDFSKVAKLEWDSRQEF